MNCATCKREMDVAGDRRSVDCGGDCAQCMGKAGDPDFAHLVRNGIAPEEVWRTKGGQGIAVGEMSEEQVRDTLRLVLRRSRKGAAKRLEALREKGRMDAIRKELVIGLKSDYESSTEKP